MQNLYYSALNTLALRRHVLILNIKNGGSYKTKQQLENELNLLNLKISRILKHISA